MKRSRKTRTFNGCWTCRKRKVKCDKNVPKCNNCAKLNRYCEGYGIRLNWSNLQILDADTKEILVQEDSSISDTNSRSKITFVKWGKPYKYYEDMDDDIHCLKVGNLDSLGKVTRGPFGMFPVAKKVDTKKAGVSDGHSVGLFELSDPISHDISGSGTGSKDSNLSLLNMNTLNEFLFHEPAIYVSNDEVSNLHEFSVLKWLHESLWKEYHLCLNVCLGKRIPKADIESKIRSSGKFFNFEELFGAFEDAEPVPELQKDDLNYDLFFQLVGYFKTQLLPELACFSNNGFNFWETILWSEIESLFLEFVVKKGEVEVLHKHIVYTVLCYASFKRHSEIDEPQLLELAIKCFKQTENVQFEDAHFVSDKKNLAILCILKIQFDPRITGFATSGAIHEITNRLLGDWRSIDHNFAEADEKEPQLRYKNLTFILKYLHVLTVFHYSVNLDDFDKEVAEPIETSEKQLKTKIFVMNKEPENVESDDTEDSEPEQIPTFEVWFQWHGGNDNDAVNGNGNGHSNGHSNGHGNGHGNGNTARTADSAAQGREQGHPPAAVLSKVERDLNTNTSDGSLLVDLSFGVPFSLVNIFSKIVAQSQNEKSLGHIEYELLNWKLDWVLEHNGKFLSKRHEFIYHNTMMFYNSMIVYFFTIIKDVPSSLLEARLNEMVQHWNCLQGLDFKLNFFFPVFILACECDVSTWKLQEKCLSFFNDHVDGNWIAKQTIFEVSRLKNFYSSEEVSWFDVSKNFFRGLCVL